MCFCSRLTKTSMDQPRPRILTPHLHEREELIGSAFRRPEDLWWHQALFQTKITRACSVVANVTHLQSTTFLDVGHFHEHRQQPAIISTANIEHTTMSSRVHEADRFDDLPTPLLLATPWYQ